MRKTLHLVSGILAAIMLAVTLGVGVYQGIQISNYLASDRSMVTDKWCSIASSNLCTEWPDRFMIIALGAFVPLLLGPFILIFLNTRRVVDYPMPLQKRVLIWLVITGACILVYLSGLLTYALV